MGAWTVSETGLIYEMEYTNGFKRAIRKSQIAKSNTYQGIDYSSSQNPNLVLAKILASIQSYTAGTSTIDFTNNGGDDWTVGFKIAVNNMPSGWSVDDYDYNVTFFQSGAQTLIESGTKTADYDVTSNLNGNGAGVYAMSAQYNMSNGVDNLLMIIGYLIKVDGSGNIIGAIMNNGLIVNSVNGLDVNYTVDIEQVGVSEQLNVDAVDGVTSANTNLSHSENDTITLPLGTGGIAVYTDLDPTFWAEIGRASCRERVSSPV